MGDGVSTSEHLAEMDRLLREIQLELAPDREPEPALADLPPTEAAPPPPPGSEAAPPPPPAQATPRPPPAAGTPSSGAPPTHVRDRNSEFQAVTARLAASLVASMRELLDGYEHVLVPIRLSAPPQTRAAPAHPSAGADEPEVTVAAGPFATVEALREFEQAVSRLTGVRDVAVRGYEGTDRAIIEVRLDHSRP